MYQRTESNAMSNRSGHSGVARVRDDESVIEICVERADFRLYVNGCEIGLSRSEFAILMNLSRRKDQRTSAQALSRDIYSILFEDDRARHLTLEVDRLGETLRRAVGRDVIHRDERGYILSAGMDVKVRALPCFGSQD
jgi:DNA-binding response OmpR family regulator